MSHTVSHHFASCKPAASICRVIPFNKTEKHLSTKKKSAWHTRQGLLAIPTTALVHVVKDQDLILLEASGNYTTVWLKNGKKIITSRSLKHIERALSTDAFLRIHQSFIVNKTCVRLVKKDTLELTNGRTLNIARSRRKAVQAWISIIRIF